MLTLSSSIVVPNINKMQVTNVTDNEQASTLSFFVIPQGGGLPYSTFSCYISNGLCTGVGQNPTLSSLFNEVIPVQLTIPTAYTDCQAQMTGSNGVRRAKNIEGYMSSVGLLPSGTVA